jgi:hypothetical protein
MKAMAIIGIILAAVGGFFSVSMMLSDDTTMVGFGILTGVIFLYFLIFSILDLAKQGSKPAA